MEKKTDMTAKIIASSIMKYNSSMSKLHTVGADYLNKAANNEKAKENLFKVYQGYSILSYIIMMALLVFAGFMMIKHNQPQYAILMIISPSIPITIRWSLKNVLNISAIEYSDWKKDKKK